MKRDKMYTWPRWDSQQWSISIDLQRWAIGFWWTKYMFGITLGPFEIIFYPKRKEQK